MRFSELPCKRSTKWTGVMFHGLLRDSSEVRWCTFFLAYQQLHGTFLLGDAYCRILIRVWQKGFRPFRIFFFPCFHSFVSSGSPTPVIRWYRKEAMLDASTTQPNETYVESELVIRKISRNDQHAKYTCHAINNNISAPEEASVIVDLYRKYPDIVHFYGL